MIRFDVYPFKVVVKEDLVLQPVPPSLVLHYVLDYPRALYKAGLLTPEGRIASLFTSAVSDIQEVRYHRERVGSYIIYVFAALVASEWVSPGSDEMIEISEMEETLIHLLKQASSVLGINVKGLRLLNRLTAGIKESFSTWLAKYDAFRNAFMHALSRRFEVKGIPIPPAQFAKVLREEKQWADIFFECFEEEGLTTASDATTAVEEVASSLEKLEEEGKKIAEEYIQAFKHVKETVKPPLPRQNLTVVLAQWVNRLLAAVQNWKSRKDLYRELSSHTSTLAGVITQHLTRRLSETLGKMKEGGVLVVWKPLSRFSVAERENPNFSKNFDDFMRTVQWNKKSMLLWKYPLIRVKITPPPKGSLEDEIKELVKYVSTHLKTVLQEFFKKELQHGLGALVKELEEQSSLDRFVKRFAVALSNVVRRLVREPQLLE